MSKARQGDTVYVVERAAYRAWDFRTLKYEVCEDEQGASFVPVRAFRSKAAAESCRAALEAEVKASLPPALFADDTIPNGLAERVEALGLPPLSFSGDSYRHADQFREWWAENAQQITAEQQAAIWELFAGVVLYRVQSTKLGG